MTPYSVLIIGAGRIGAFFDTPASDAVLSHAHGFSSHPGFHLLGFVDTVHEQAERAAKLWGCEAYASVADAFARHQIDLAVVATPDEMHYKLLKELACQPLRLVFAEKPLTGTIEEAEDIVNNYRQRGISLAVNYSRRYVPEFNLLREEIASGSFGRFLAGSGYYGKGTQHNGTHLIDLLRFLMGEIQEVKTWFRLSDYHEDDPTCSAVLKLERGGDVVIQAIDCRSHTIFELDLLFWNRRVRIIDSGFSMEIHAVQDDPLFAGYRKLQCIEVQETTLSRALASAAQHIHAHLASAAPLPCTGTDGLIAQKICASIINGSL